MSCLAFFSIAAALLSAPTVALRLVQSASASTGTGVGSMEDSDWGWDQAMGLRTQERLCTPGRIMHDPGLVAQRPDPSHFKPKRIRDCRTVHDKITLLHPLVIPAAKLAFCYIPKVACTDFKDLFNAYNGWPAATFGYGHGYGKSMAPAMNVSMDEITKENGWKFATFTRDPALRFLSSVGSACVSSNDTFEHREECCGPFSSNEVPVGRMASFVYARIQIDLEFGTVKDEQHWASQVEHLRNCGWDKFRPENLDYWGHLNGNMNAQVKEMLMMAGIENLYPVDLFFPKGKVVGHKNPVKGNATALLSNAKTLRGIRELYADDYEHLPGVGCSFSDPLLASLEADESRIGRAGGNATEHAV